MARALRHRDRARREAPAARELRLLARRRATTPSRTPTSGRGRPRSSGELWNATGFRGAELTYAELLAARRPARRGARVLHRRRKEALAMTRGTACWPPTSCPRAASRRSPPATRASRSSHYDGQFAALDNHCPHQGGPLGEGSIENGLLRCPWHGYDYCPLDGSSPGLRRRRRRPTRSRSATARSSSASSRRAARARPSPT